MQNFLTIEIVCACALENILDVSTYFGLEKLSFYAALVNSLKMV